MGVMVHRAQVAEPPEEGWSRLGEVSLLLGLPIGMLFVSLLLLLNLSAGVEAWNLDEDGQAALLVFYFLLMLPYAVAGGALEAVYGGHARVVPCCFFVMLGVAAGTVVPVVVASELDLLSGTMTTWAVVGSGSMVQMAAAVASLLLVRRSRRAQVLHARAASG